MGSRPLGKKTFSLSAHHEPTYHRRIQGRGRGGCGAPFFLYFQNVLRFCFENRFIKCSSILSSEMLTLLYFALRIGPQYCMLHVLKSEVFSLCWWGKAGGLGPLFLNFLDLPLLDRNTLLFKQIVSSVANQRRAFVIERQQIITKTHQKHGTFLP